MSKLRISSDLFMGVSELKRFQSFLREYSERTLFYDTFTYGLYKNKVTDPTFRNGKVEVATANSIKIASIVAIDNQMRLISKNEVAFLEQIEACPCEIDSVSIPNDGNTYWIRVRYNSTSEEEGLVSLDASDNSINGIGTSFTQTLRGGEDATSVRILDSTLNTSDLRVATVVDDVKAILHGDVITEGDLLDEATLKKFATVGRFSDGFNTAPENKLIYEFDSYDVLIEVGTGTNGEDAPLETTIPDGTTEVFGENSFFLASVINTGSGLTITDKRESYFSHKGEYNYSKIDEDIFSITSVESCKFDTDATPQTENIVTVGWGLRCPNINYSYNENSITLTNFNGGNVNNDPITAGDLDDWLVYFDNGTKRSVVSSTNDGGAIKLVLDVLNSEDITLDGILQTSDISVKVVPNAEKVVINLQPVGKDIVYSEAFAIEEAYGTMNVPLYGTDETFTYAGTHYFINNKTQTQEIPLMDGTYYDENAYDEDYALVGSPTTKDIENNTGVFELIQHPNTYANFKASIITGDKFGFANFPLSDAPTESYKSVTVGADATNQKMVYSTSTQTADWYINLDKTGAKAGNIFEFQFEGNITSPTNGKEFVVTQGFDGVGSPSVAQTVFDMTKVVNESGSFYYDQMRLKNLKFTFTYDGTNWIPAHHSSVRPNKTPKLAYSTPTTPQSPVDANGGTDLEIFTHTVVASTKQNYYGTITANSDWIFQGLTNCRWYLEINGTTVDQFILNTDDANVSKGRATLSFAGVEFNDGDTIRLLVTATSATQCTIIETKISYLLVS